MIDKSPKELMQAVSRNSKVVVGLRARKIALLNELAEIDIQLEASEKFGLELREETRRRQGEPTDHGHGWGTIESVEDAMERHPSGKKQHDRGIGR